MSDIKIINTLLKAASPVTAIVVDRVYPTELPQGTALPALGLSHLSSIELATLDAASGFRLIQSRVEVTVLTKDYVTLKDLIRKVRQACNYQHGVIAGLLVASIRVDIEGPDSLDAEMEIFTQTIDFLLTWQDPT